MRKLSAIIVVLVLAALPCFGDVFVLNDGTEIEGAVIRTSSDGRVTIKMENGVSTYHVSEFAPKTVVEHFANVDINAPKRPGSSKSSRTRHSEIQDASEKEKVVLGLMLGGIAFVVIGSLWMIISAFAETPVWGIAFLLSAGIAELAFIFVHWERAKSPLMTQFLGGALFIAATLVAK